MKLTNGGPPITADGSYEIDAKPGDTLLVDLDGTFDGASALLKYRSAAGNDQPVLDANGDPVGGPTSWVARVDVPKSGILSIAVTAAGAGTSLRVGWVNVARGPQGATAGVLVGG